MYGVNTFKLFRSIGPGITFSSGYSETRAKAAKKLISMFSSKICTALNGLFPNEKETRISKQRQLSIAVTWNCK